MYHSPIPLSLDVYRKLMVDYSDSWDHECAEIAGECAGGEDTVDEGGGGGGA